ncbi:MAG: type II toxin-antitoxin system HicB family antitoxin [Methylovulum sp.]|nr:type II toxin-antitoxin system HicB family antitoxin [Methylovulum sp.]
MTELKYTWWKSDIFYIGYWNEYPDYMTQGLDQEELINNLKSLLEDIRSNEIPYIRKTETLMVA